MNKIGATLIALALGAAIQVSFLLTFGKMEVTMDWVIALIVFFCVFTSLTRKKRPNI